MANLRRITVRVEFEGFFVLLIRKCIGVFTKKEHRSPIEWTDLPCFLGSSETRGYREESAKSGHSNRPSSQTLAQLCILSLLGKVICYGCIFIQLNHKTY